LIAIASGELVYRPFKQLPGKKWRSGCWTEVSDIVAFFMATDSKPLMMDAVFWEFSEDTAK